LFKGLDRIKITKINELIDALNEKNRLIEKQDDLLFEEHDKVVEVEKSLALKLKKNELLSTELSSYHSSIYSFKTINDDLNARIEKLNVQVKNANDKLNRINFARDAYTIGRHPSIKDGLGFQKGAKDKKCHEAPNFIKKRGKRLWIVAHIILILARTMLTFMLM
jgi:septal ring factor EnvC (AmiA/AmiB activator)